jgi:hypothetical protein
MTDYRDLHDRDFSEQRLRERHAGIDDKTPISRLALTENNVLRLHT